MTARALGGLRSGVGFVADEGGRLRERAELEVRARPEPAKETVVPSFGDSAESESSTKRWPPPPHDPRERDLATTIDAWEVRVFGNRQFQYFVTRGLWHVQLWHAGAGLSILTPSRLTRGCYEAYPVANWKAHEANYEDLAVRIAAFHAVPLLTPSDVRGIERAFVDTIVASIATATPADAS